MVHPGCLVLLQICDVLAVLHSKCSLSIMFFFVLMVATLRDVIHAYVIFTALTGYVFVFVIPKKVYKLLFTEQPNLLINRRCCDGNIFKEKKADIPL